jgi:ribosome-binding protein aMBF1 (putative translation factor)
MDGQDWKPIVLSKTSTRVNTPYVSIVKIPASNEDGFIEKPKMFTIEFGRRVEQFRTAKGLKRAELAQRLNVKEHYIENLERGKELYNGMMLGKLKKILGNEL